MAKPMSDNKPKREWTKPKLVVLVRGRAEEAGGVCKVDAKPVGPTQIFTECIDWPSLAPSCEACSGIFGT